VHPVSNIAQFLVFQSPEMKKKQKKLKKSWNIFHFGLDFFKKWEYITNSGIAVGKTVV
jgi:hypothetical protein